MIIKSIAARAAGAVIWTSVGLFATAPAIAASWQYPNELAVTKACNDIFFTNYDTTTKEGLAALITDHGATMQSQWTTATAATVTVLAMDTTNAYPIGIKVGATTLIVKDPGPWTPPSRGYLNDPINGRAWTGGVLDIATLLTSNGFSATRRSALSWAGHSWTLPTPTGLVTTAPMAVFPWPATKGA